jgi:hypothetical protein
MTEIMLSRRQLELTGSQLSLFMHDESEDDEESKPILQDALQSSPEESLAINVSTNPHSSRGTDAAALRLGVYVFDHAGEVTVAPLTLSHASQLVIDATLSFVRAVYPPGTRCHPNYTAVYSCLHRRKRGTPKYIDAATNEFVAEVACRDCTTGRRTCVIRPPRAHLVTKESGYDLVLAPLAREFRLGVAPNSTAYFISQQAPDESVTSRFEKEPSHKKR